MTHDELVARAVKWLKGSQRCWAVLSEVVTTHYEYPDAMGWRSDGVSILIECKTSRADYRADIQHKRCHRQDRGMGGFRYFMTSPGLVHKDELPAKWGLLEVHPTLVRKVKHAAWRGRAEYDRFVRHEMKLLITGLRNTQREDEG